MSENLPKKIYYRSKNRFTKKRRPYKKYDKSTWKWNDILDEALILYKTDKNFIATISEKYGIIHSTLKDNFILIYHQIKN